MKILAVADEENKGIWDHYEQNKEQLRGVDLILACGDLKKSYLEFLVTMTNAPLLYVHGNHDTSYDTNPPEGCICIEDTVYNFEGLRILGLGGSYKYKDTMHMYTEEEMRRRIVRLGAQLRIKNGFDILLAHAPAKNFGDMEDIPHRGFECFNTLMNQYKPALMLHGHVHPGYGRSFERERMHPCGTKIINVYDKYIFDMDQNSYPPQGKTGSALYDLYVNLIQMKKR